MAATSRRPTIKDVARQVGVSFQTVSRAINDKPEIDPQTRRRVLEAARELGYRPSRHARGLVSPTLSTVGVIVPDLVNPYFPEMISGVIDAAAERGWTVVVATSTGHRDDEARLLRSLAGQVDAVVGYLNHTGETGAGEGGAGEGGADGPGAPDVPLVLLDQEAPGPGRAGVRVDVGHGVRAGIAHLVELSLIHI